MSFLLAVALLPTFVGSPSLRPTTAAPSLRIVTVAPLTLRGSGFRPRERVRMTLTVARRTRRSTLSANAAGGFLYRPSPFVVVDVCRGTLVVSALGVASGSRATWKRACRPPDRWPASVLRGPAA